MLSARVSTRISRRVAAEISKPGGQLWEGVNRAGGKVRNEARAMLVSAGRIDRGDLSGSIVVQVEAVSGGIRATVTARAEHAMYQHEGVQGPIYPRRARVLRFRPKGSSAYVFARSVSGFEGVPFLRQPVERLDPSAFTT